VKMNRLVWALAGVLVGVLIATALPVGAHHNDRRLKRRVARLESQMTTVRAKTQYLTRDGFHFRGFLFGEQVIGFCDPAAPAVWEQTTGDPEAVWIDDCFVAEQREAMVESLSRN